MQWACSAFGPSLSSATWRGTDIWGDTPLHQATARARSAAVRDIVAAGADPNAAGFYGLRPRMVALIHNRLANAAALPANASLAIDRPNELARRCYLAGVFGLSGTTSWQGQPVDLDNHLHEGVIAGIADAWTRFAQLPRPLIPFRLNEIGDALHAAPTHVARADAALVEDFMRGKLLMVATGWRGHATMHVFSYPYAIRVNRLMGGQRTFVVMRCSTARAMGHIVHTARAVRHWPALAAMVRLHLVERAHRVDSSNAVARAIRGMAPAPLKPGKCCFGNTKAAIRAALVVQAPQATQAVQTTYKQFTAELRRITLDAYSRSAAETSVDADLIKRCNDVLAAPP